MDMHAIRTLDYDGKREVCCRPLNILRILSEEVEGPARVDAIDKENSIFLTSTEFLQNEYGACADHFKKRLGLKGETNLFVLRNVTISPFPSARNFISKLASIFEKVASEEVNACRLRVSIDAINHSFTMQGITKFYLAYKPLFYEADDRMQIVLEAEIQHDAMAAYIEARESPFVLKTGFLAFPDATAIAYTEKTRQGYLLYGVASGNARKLRVVKLPDILAAGTLKADINFSNSGEISAPSSATPITPRNYMPFYAYSYGTPEETHIDHMLLCEEPEKGAILYMDEVAEVSMQPFDMLPSATELRESSFSFRQGESFNMTIYRDTHEAKIYRPGIVNSDPLAIKEVNEGLEAWKAEIDKEFP
ncbi:hypothetical protein DFP73DRAFT_632400 [Morchella snyderi]|nr:hypothetical protein DFP73DRAFT_632400 [Morchella snyderi]